MQYATIDGKMGWVSLPNKQTWANEVAAGTDRAVGEGGRGGLAAVGRRQLEEKEGGGVGVSAPRTWARPVRPAGEGLWCTQANHFHTKCKTGQGSVLLPTHCTVSKPKYLPSLQSTTLNP